jgi:hypothetical protein
MVFRWTVDLPEWDALDPEVRIAYADTVRAARGHAGEDGTAEFRSRDEAARFTESTEAASSLRPRIVLRVSADPARARPLSPARPLRACPAHQP